MEITTTYFDKDENEKEIQVAVEVSAGYDGIGPYEYWGSKEFDKGQLCVDIDKTSYDKTGLTENEVNQIEKEISSKNFKLKAQEEYLDEQQRAREYAAELAYELREESKY